MVMAGEVLVDNQRVQKAGKRFPPACSIRLVRQRARFVSRAGFKLDAAIRHFGIDVCGKTCLDIGASTGGFTDCLLQRNAKRVFAVDVGYGQLHWSIRQDDRVVVRERFNARYLSVDDIGEMVDFAVCDVSFISVRKILPRLAGLLRTGGRAVVLAKPQFEVGKGRVGKGGIVRDPRQHSQVVASVAKAMSGFGAVRWVESPVRGASGNLEFLMYGTDWAPPGEGVDA